MRVCGGSGLSLGWGIGNLLIVCLVANSCLSVHHHDLFSLHRYVKYKVKRLIFRHFLNLQQSPATPWSLTLVFPETLDLSFKQMTSLLFAPLRPIPLMATRLQRT